ncbi:MAG TPA: hypothetical protein VEX38_10055, partial [Fimbriimonadaceae bacterium]|nr:hypothetical protein [Fimbriimonadaceae bacterium]
MRTDSPAKVWAVTFAVAIFPLLGFWLYGLFDLDEGFYAAVSWEMMQRGEWITPYYNGNPWFEKPILLYWFAIPSISAFGEEVGPRLPAVLATVSLYGVCGIFLARCVSLTAGRLCVLILGSCLLLVGVGRMM